MLTEEEMVTLLTIIRAMDENTPPFESLVAELGGIAPARMKATLTRGVELAAAGSAHSHPCVAFALEVRQHQATWKMKALQSICRPSGNKEHLLAMKHLQWVLEKLDPTVFDSPRVAPPVAAPVSNTASSVQEVAKAVASLSS